MDYFRAHYSVSYTVGPYRQTGFITAEVDGEELPILKQLREYIKYRHEGRLWAIGPLERGCDMAAEAQADGGIKKVSYGRWSYELVSKGCKLKVVRWRWES